jgi:hypothetical protein
MPLILVCAGIGLLRMPLGFAGTVVAGVLVGLTYALCARSLILGYPPVAALIRSRLALLRLDGLLGLAGLEGTGRP